jgi:hypothetical protein
MTSATAAFAAPGYSLCGNAAYETPGANGSSRAVNTTSEGYDTYGGIDFPVPAGLTLGTLDTLSTDLKSTVGGCGGGSPRFVALTDAGYVYFFLNCTADGLYHNTGNLATPTSLVDYDLGTGYHYQNPYGDVQANFGNMAVTELFLVTDGGWAVGGTQNVSFDNVNVDGTVYPFDTPTTKDQCKNGGYLNYEGGNGQPFRNQGDCIQFVNTGR